MGVVFSRDVRAWDHYVYIDPIPMSKPRPISFWKYAWRPETNDLWTSGLIASL